nr:MAG TPA: hypothetical protein [Caudoviricetes sp.]DAS28211.1 MAG TPA: hypothetical protein [Caudoviricetes sp.]
MLYIRTLHLYCFRLSFRLALLYICKGTKDFVKCKRYNEILRAIYGHKTTRHY